MKISVQPDIKPAIRHLKEFERKQIPFAASQALNDTAFDARRAVQVQLPQKLDRPVPATIRGVRVERSQKRRLIAWVYFVDYISRVMKYQVEGGTRRPRRRAIPVPVGIKKNTYGNIGRGRLQRLVDRPTTFVGEIEGVPGIWDRKTGRLLVAWKSKAVYKPRFPFHRIVAGVVRSKFRRHFAIRLRAALRRSQ